MYTVIPTEQFEKDVKYYVKKKGYIHIGKDIKVITDELEQGNLIGTEIPTNQEIIRLVEKYCLNI